MAIWKYKVEAVEEGWYCDCGTFLALKHTICDFCSGEICKDCCDKYRRAKATVTKDQKTPNQDVFKTTFTRCCTDGCKEWKRFNFDSDYCKDCLSEREKVLREFVDKILADKRTKYG